LDDLQSILEKRISVAQALKLLDIDLPQFFNLCKSGKLRVYNDLGKRLVDINSCEKRKECTFDEILKYVRVGEAGNRADPRCGPRDYLTEEEIMNEAQREYAAQPLDTPIVPEGCVVFDFSLPDWPTKRTEEKFKKALLFKCRESDVLAIAGKMTPLRSEAKKNLMEKVFPCNPGTEWKDVKITLIDEATVRIATP